MQTKTETESGPVQHIVTPDSVVESYILQVLDDYQKHDWDEAMIAAMEGFDKLGMCLGARQLEKCLHNLISKGEVVEKWSGDWATLRRVKLPSKSIRDDRRLFSV